MLSREPKNRLERCVMLLELAVHAAEAASEEFYESSTPTVYTVRKLAIERFFRFQCHLNRLLGLLRAGVNLPPIDEEGQYLFFDRLPDGLLPDQIRATSTPVGATAHSRPSSIRFARDRSSCRHSAIPRIHGQGEKKPGNLQTLSRDLQSVIERLKSAI